MGAARRGPHPRGVVLAVAAIPMVAPRSENRERARHVHDTAAASELSPALLARGPAGRSDRRRHLSPGHPVRRPGQLSGRPMSPAGGSPVTATGDGAVPAAGNGAATQVAESPVTTGHLRRVFLGPRRGGTLRRRASDAFRLGFAILVVAASIPVMRANSDAEIAIVHALNPPPAAISWLVTALFWLGSVGVVAGLTALALLVPRLAAVRRIAVAGLATWAVCALLGAALGPTAGRPDTTALAGVDTGYPVVELAVAIAVAATALPYLRRALHRLVSFLIVVAVFAGIVAGAALPVNAVSSVAIGWGVAAALHLAFGSPLGLPSAAEVAGGIADLGVAVTAVTRAPHQVWGLEKFTGQDRGGGTVELSVYGRDAADARMLAKLWRFCLYRDSGPTLILGRDLLVEHEAYMTLMAGRAGVPVPEVLAVGRFGPSGDTAIVTRLPAGTLLADADLAAAPDATLDEILGTVLRLRAAGIAHGRLGQDTVLLSGQGPCIRSFRSSSSPAPVSRLDADLAAVLAATAVRAGVERAAAAAARMLGAETARGALVHLQRA